MVKANNFWHFTQPSTWQSHYFKCMKPLPELQQLECLPACVNPGPYMSGSPGRLMPDLPGLKAEQTNEAYGWLQCFPALFPTSSPSTNLCLGEKQSPFTYELSGQAMPTAMPVSSQKRILIFDQSGTQTRLVYDSVYAPVQNPNIAFANFVQTDLAVKTEKHTPMKPVLHEECDENPETDEERGTHEDTEEINALLYSDEDDYGDDSSVMSTDHSPYAIEEMADEVDSSDSPNKRQKLFDGGYSTLSQKDTASSVKVKGTLEYIDDTESCYASGQTGGGKVGSILGKRQSRKDKIRSTLKVLESIIPSAKGKEPLLVLDEAIDYLKSLKHKAQTLGVNYF